MLSLRTWANAQEIEIRKKKYIYLWSQDVNIFPTFFTTTVWIWQTPNDPTSLVAAEARPSGPPATLGSGTWSGQLEGSFRANHHVGFISKMDGTKKCFDGHWMILMDHNFLDLHMFSWFLLTPSWWSFDKLLASCQSNSLITSSRKPSFFRHRPRFFHAEIHCIISLVTLSGWKGWISARLTRILGWSYGKIVGIIQSIGFVVSSW